AAQIGRRPGVELGALKIGAARRIERLLLKRPATRGVAGAAMAEALDEIGAAIPRGVVIGIRRIGAALREENIPDRERPAPAEHAADFARLVRLFDRRHLLHEEGV